MFSQFIIHKAHKAVTRRNWTACCNVVAGASGLLETPDFIWSLCNGTVSSSV